MYFIKQACDVRNSFLIFITFFFFVLKWWTWETSLALIVFMFGFALNEMVCHIASSISISFKLIFNTEGLVMPHLSVRRKWQDTFRISERLTHFISPLKKNQIKSQRFVDVEFGFNSRLILILFNYLSINWKFFCKNLNRLDEFFYQKFFLTKQK